MRIRLVAIRPGQAIERQRHLKRTEHWTVLSGEGWVRLGRPSSTIEMLGAKRGDCLQLERGEWHQAGVNAAAKNPLVVLQVWFGEELTEDDVELAPASSMTA